MNPLSLIPNKVRMALYLIYAIGVVVLTYTKTRGWTGDAEHALWLGLGAVFGVAAASNVPIGAQTPNSHYFGEDHYVEDIAE